MASSEALGEYRPYLEIEYIPTGAAPTPTPTRTPTAQPPSPAPTVTLLPALGRYVFQQGVDGYSGCEDTYVDAWNPQANSAFSDKLSLRQGGVRSALIRFDIRALPAESYIQSARLVFYVRSQSGSHALPVRAYNVLQPWRVQEATYQRASRERAWYKEGLNGVGRDISVDPVSSASLTSVGQRVALDVTSLAREWVSVPEHNHGVVIKAEGAVAVEYTFYSADSPQPALRPQLEIEWRVIPPSPTPTRTTAVPTATPTFTATPTRTPSPTATRPTVRLVLQQGVSDYDRTTDTRLDAWNQTAVFGREQSVNIRQTNIRVALIRFGLEALPADAKVTEAILSLWATERTNASNLTVRAYLLRRPWNDKAATWLEADTGLAWALPGANGADVDRAAAPLAALTVTGTGQWVSLDVTDAVRRWAANPQSNHGLLLRGEGPANVDYRFAASEHWDRTLRPKLTIVYAPGPQTASRGRGAKGPSRLLASDILPWLVMAAAVVILPYLTVGKRRKRWGRRRAGRL